MATPVQQFSLATVAPMLVIKQISPAFLYITVGSSVET